ncbi:N-acetyltransferase [Phenylobacterium aquaticum]|uniref:GNAT family N-acetyltransferase n=1 Tax=Phenylobacterium aquaticum TaxID=1763816 RepID=UPI0026EF04A3|nr:GNAT family N-acetyltransferase [Phenylobacterium aquaticum]
MTAPGSLPGLALRQAQAHDAAAIAALVHAAYAPWIPLIGREPKPMTVDYAQALKANRFDLLEDGARLMALIETAVVEDHLLVVNVAVGPEAQGLGLGQRLLAHAEGLARAAGLGELRLYTNQRFARNIEIYRRFGYEIDREETLPNGVTVHMRKATPTVA